MIKNGIPQGSILGPLFFLIHINDLPKVINKCASMVLFADDTSILIANSNKLDFNENIKKTLQEVNAWFKNNMLTLNFNETRFLEFRTTHSYSATTQNNYDLSGITNANKARFLGLILGNNLSWKQHIDKIVSKMCWTCYDIRNIKILVSQDTLKVTYFAHIHSILSFWGNTYHSKKVFTIQKKIIRL